MKSESTEAACDEEPEGWEGRSMDQRTLHAINAGDVMSGWYKCTLANHW